MVTKVQYNAIEAHRDLCSIAHDRLTTSGLTEHPWTTPARPTEDHGGPSGPEFSEEYAACKQVIRRLDTVCPERTQVIILQIVSVSPFCRRP